MVAVVLLAAWLGVADVSASLKTFELTRVDANVLSALKHAWMLSEQGRSSKEAGVLLTRNASGEYAARVVFDRDSSFQVRFLVTEDTVALFHTHPNNSGCEPSLQDRRNADLLGIPTFTMTSRGLWMYDPKTRRTTLVMPRTVWLEERNWNGEARR